MNPCQLFLQQFLGLSKVAGCHTKEFLRLLEQYFYRPNQHVKTLKTLCIRLETHYVCIRLETQSSLLDYLFVASQHENTSYPEICGFSGATFSDVNYKIGIYTKCDKNQYRTNSDHDWCRNGFRN